MGLIHCSEMIEGENTTLSFKIFLQNTNEKSSQLAFTSLTSPLK